MKRLVIATALLTSALLIAAVEPPVKEVGPLVEISGSFSQVDKPRVEVIGDAARWEQVWKEHMGDKIERTSNGFDVTPRVDFARCMVVAMFSGKTVNTAGWHVVSTHERDGNIVIRYDEARFQSMSTGDTDAGFAAAGYGFAVLSRSSLPMILEENIQTLIDRGPIWKERQRLPALPAGK